MPTLQLEHAIKDFDMWKAAFDRDPIDRRGLGVRHHRVFRPLDDPSYVVVELDFDTTSEAEACRAAPRSASSGARARLRRLSSGVRAYGSSRPWRAGSTETSRQPAGRAASGVRT